VANSGEHRMVFDLRGKRKRLVQVVYALLALLMTTSLFFVVGPVNLNGLFGNGGGSSTNFDDQAQQVEQKLAKDPKNPKLLASDVRARYTAGSAQVQTDPSTGQTSVTQGAIDDFNRAGDAWLRYLKVAGANPSPSIAAFAVKAFTSTLTTGTSLADVTSNLNAAVDAQKVIVDARPSLGSYATLAQIAYFAGDKQTADQAAQNALQVAPAAQRSSIKGAIAQYKQIGDQIQKQINAAEKAAKANPGAGKQALQNPLGGLSGGGSGLSGSP
jgi:hypothetical protein